MNNGKNKLNESLLKKYRKAFYNFDKYLDEIYSNYFNYKEHKGYLINLKDFEKIKEVINYKYYMEKGDYKNDDINFAYSEKVFKIKKIEFNTSQYILNMIINNNSYIIINADLWKALCEIGKENENPIIYNIYTDSFVLNLENRKFLFFNYSQSFKNIIKSSSYKGNFSYNLNEFYKILKDINNYYNFEKKFCNELKIKNNNSVSNKIGYLVSKEWINKWKQYSNYKEIKRKYLEQNLNKHEILNNLIYQKEKYNYNYRELNSIQIISCKNKKDLESFLEKDSLVIINDIFPKSFQNSIVLSDYIKYSLNDKIINIILNNETLNFISHDNILSYENIINIKHNSNDNEDNLIHVKQLIKIFYFKKELNKNINSLNKNNDINSNHIYLVSTKIMEKYKDLFEYKKLYEFLNNNHLKILIIRT